MGNVQRKAPARGASAIYRSPGWSLTLVLFPASLVKMVTAILLAPLRRNKMFPVPLALVSAMDPRIVFTICVVPVIPSRDDITFASRQLLMSWRRRRTLHVDREPFCVDRNSERARKCDGQKRFLNVHKRPRYVRIIMLSCLSTTANQRNAETLQSDEMRLAGKRPTYFAG
jgi:hypothetical protein